MNKYKIIWVLFCFSLLVPSYRIEQIRLSLGLEDLLVLIALLFISKHILENKTIKVTPIYRCEIILFIAIILIGIILGVFSGAIYIGKLTLPTEIWQIVKRLVYFILPIYLIVKNRISIIYAVKTLVIAVFTSLLIGVFQLPMFPISEYLAVLYESSEGQSREIVNRSFLRARIYSVAGFSTAWGLFSAWCLTLFISLSFYVLKHNNKFYSSRFIIYSGVILSFFNLIKSGARSSQVALLAILITIIIIAIIDIVINMKMYKKNFKILAIIISGGVSVIAAFLFYFSDILELILFRWAALELAYEGGGDRFSQIRIVYDIYFEPLDLYALIFGIGFPSLRELYISHGIEVEHFHILATYGILGFILRYLLMFLIFKTSWNLYQNGQTKFNNYRPLGLAGMLGVISYFVGSIGYFFFQAYQVGVTPWLFFGIIYAANFKLKTKKSFKINQSKAINVAKNKRV